ncbi:hypothetical protein B0H14DRAFT_3476604 [Mycena olivaceomarginata]|nr:hypothetical protein B0H14DRAFT_3476604 [Mycena olivaceomarginata]
MPMAFLLLFIPAVSAVPTNLTIDDCDPRVLYYPSTDLLLCNGCLENDRGLDVTQLFNGTVTTWAGNYALQTQFIGLEINFTGARNLESNMPESNPQLRNRDLFETRDT